MKVVINTCFGGFGLSGRAYQEIAKAQGRPIYFFNNIYNGGSAELKPITLEETEGNLFFSAYDLEDPNGTLPNNDDWGTLSMEERAARNKIYTDHTFEDFSQDRSNPLLVHIVEELGKDSWGRCAELKVVEIPDGVDFEIDEYDGSEHIAEKHRTWN